MKIEKDISNFFINDFIIRFTSRNPRFNFELFDPFRPYIIEEENEELTKVVTDEETYEALSYINNIKVSSPYRLLNYVTCLFFGLCVAPKPSLYQPFLAPTPLDT